MKVNIRSLDLTYHCLWQRMLHYMCLHSHHLVKNSIKKKIKKHMKWILQDMFCVYSHSLHHTHLLYEPCGSVWTWSCTSPWVCPQSKQKHTHIHKCFALSVCWLSAQTANSICHYLTTNKITRAQREKQTGSIIVTCQECSLLLTNTHIHRHSELLRAQKHSSNRSKRIKCQNNSNTNQETNALKTDH